MMISINDLASGSNRMNEATTEGGFDESSLTEETRVSEHWTVMDLCYFYYLGLQSSGACSKVFPLPGRLTGAIEQV